MSGLVKHDDSDTAQRSSQVHALIKYAARQVSSILTTLDAFALYFFYFGAITQCNCTGIAIIDLYLVLKSVDKVIESLLCRKIMATMDSYLY